MVNIFQEKEEDSTNFIVKGSVGIHVKRAAAKDSDQNALFVYKKGDKKKKSIAILQTDGVIEFQAIKDNGLDGVKITTNQEADLSSIQMRDRTIFFFAKK